MKKTLLLGASCAFALTLPAQAQLLVGTSNYTTGEHYHVDLATGVGTPMLANWINMAGGGATDLVGMGADDANCTLYIAQTNGNGAYIYEWIYNDPAGPQLILTDPVDSATAATIRCEGIEFVNGTLYALDEFGGGGSAEGIYSIDLTTGVATLEFAYNAGNDVGGLGYNPANGLFYGSDDANGVIRSFDIVNDVEAVVGAYPAGVTDVDSLTVDPTGTTIYLVEDNAAPLHAYDLATGTYSATPVASPIVSAWTFSASAWAPGFDPAGGMCTGGIGTPYCSAGNPNSTGALSNLIAMGSAAVANNDVTLIADMLPANAFGFFLTSQTQAMTPNPGGSDGILCLGGMIGRYVGTGQIQNSGAAGSFSLVLDLTQHPQPNGFVSVAAGETWNFQGWHRDSNMGVATSNFTNGVEVTFN